MKADSKTVFNYIKEHEGENITAPDIAKETGLGIQKVNGIITSALIGTGKNKANKSDYELNDDHYPHHVHHNAASDAQTSAPVCPAP